MDGGHGGPAAARPGGAAVRSDPQSPRPALSQRSHGDHMNPAATTGLVLQTQTDAPAGLLGPWAQSRGLSLQVLRVDRGEPLPDPASVGFVIALGSDKSVVDGGMRWIKHEVAWLGAAIAADTPVLGICFGA